MANTLAEILAATGVEAPTNVVAQIAVALKAASLAIPDEPEPAAVAGKPTEAEQKLAVHATWRRRKRLADKVKRLSLTALVAKAQQISLDVFYWDKKESDGSIVATIKVGGEPNDAAIIAAVDAISEQVGR